MKFSSIVSKFDFRCVTLFDRLDYGVFVLVQVRQFLRDEMRTRIGRILFYFS